VRYIRENAAFKDAKTLRERYYVCARFLFERNQCEMKIRARDWWFFTCFFSFSEIRAKGDFSSFLRANKKDLSLSAVLDAAR
jgi:hypothetical protein